MAVSVVTTDPAVQKELVELDALLDANPDFERVLRDNIDQLEGESFRKTHPDVANLFNRKPRPWSKRSKSNVIF